MKIYFHYRITRQNILKKHVATNRISSRYRHATTLRWGGFQTKKLDSSGACKNIMFQNSKKLRSFYMLGSQDRRNIRCFQIVQFCIFHNPYLAGIPKRIIKCMFLQCFCRRLQRLLYTYFIQKVDTREQESRSKLCCPAWAGGFFATYRKSLKSQQRVVTRFYLR